MAFNPTLPVDGSKAKASEMRSQFNGLNDKITDLPSSVDVQQAINDSVVAQAANNVDNVGLINITLSDPPTKAELQAVIVAHNNLVNSLQH